MAIDLLTAKEIYFLSLMMQYDDEYEFQCDLHNHLEYGTSEHPEWIEEFVDNYEDWAYRDWDWNKLQALKSD